MLLASAASANLSSDCSGNWLVRGPVSLGGEVRYHFANGEVLTELDCAAVSHLLTDDSTNRADIRFLQQNSQLASEKYLNATVLALSEPQNFLLNDGFTSLDDSQRLCGSVKIAIIDSGVDSQHPALLNAAFPAQFNAITGESDQTDDYGHGTHVAGLMASTALSGTSWPQGACMNATLLPARFLGSTGGGKVADAITAIEWAVAQGADIINHSWVVTQDYDALREVIADVDQRGIVQVAAAGNFGSDLNTSFTAYPAAYGMDLDGMVVVANWDNDSQSLYSASNYGLESVDLAASGTRLLSLAPGTATQQRTGTSMAAPLVSAAMAMLKVAYPDDSSQQLRGRLLSGCAHETALNSSIRCGGRLAMPSVLEAEATLLDRTERNSDGSVSAYGIGLENVSSWQFESWLDQQNYQPDITSLSDEAVQLENLTAQPGRWWLSLSTGLQLSEPWLPELQAPAALAATENDSGWLLSWANDSMAGRVLIETDSGDGRWRSLATVDAPVSQYQLQTDSTDLLAVRLTSQLDYWPNGPDATSAVLESVAGSVLYLNADDSVWQTTRLASAAAGSSPVWRIELADGLDASYLSWPASSDVMVTLADSAVLVELAADATEANLELTWDDGDRVGQRRFNLLLNNESEWSLDTDEDFILQASSYQAQLASMALGLDGSIQLVIQQLDSDGYLYLEPTDHQQALLNASLQETNSGLLLEADADGVFIRSEAAIDSPLVVSLRLNMSGIPSATGALAGTDQRCFIASVVLQHDPWLLALLRSYRDIWLHNAPAGDWLIQRYYQYSPALAEWLLQHPQSSGFIRLLMLLALACGTLVMPLWFVYKAAAWQAGRSQVQTRHLRS
nr:S8 family serine peptidase [Oceanobacter mangrovi]